MQFILYQCRICSTVLCDLAVAKSSENVTGRRIISVIDQISCLFISERAREEMYKQRKECFSPPEVHGTAGHKLRAKLTLSIKNRCISA